MKNTWGLFRATDSGTFQDDGKLAVLVMNTLEMRQVLKYLLAYDLDQGGVIVGRRSFA